jgi:hypothetical protein
MGNFVYNRGKGRGTEWAERVNANDPTNSVLVLMVLATSGIESDATLLDKDDFAAIVSGTTNEVTNGGYARKVLDQAAGITVTYDDTNDRVDVDIPDQTWTGVAAGDGWNDIVIGYDSDSTSGADSAILPLTQHDFVVTPDGSDITAQVATGGFYRAS